MNKVLKQVIGWFIAAIFFFLFTFGSLYLLKDKDIFALPPKLFDFELSFQAYEEVLAYHVSIRRGYGSC